MNGKHTDKKGTDVHQVASRNQPMADIRITVPPLPGQVLVVHDIMYIRSQIRQILHGAGIREIVEPEPGGDAYLRLRKDPEGFSLVIDDYDTHPSGMYLLKILRQDEGTPDLLRKIPFIMMVSNPEPTSVNEVMSAGASGILLKPFNGITLLKTIKRVMEKSKNPG